MNAPPKTEEQKENANLQRIQELESLLEKEQAKTLRILADLENVKRREIENKAQWSDLAVVHFVRKILPCLSELQKGKEHSQDKALGEVIKKLMNTLEKTGLKQMTPSEKTTIDPHEHEVVLTDQGTKGCIVKTLEPGWKFNDTIILPAKVSACPNE